MSGEQVNDARRGHFYMYDDVIDDYGKELGAFGVAVYTMLCRRAGKNGSSHPSLRRMAEDLQISERQAKRELKKLKDLDLISIRPRRNEQGRQMSSEYTILDAPKAKKKPEATQSPGPQPEASETPVGEGSVSPPLKDYPESKDYVEANASRPEASDREDSTKVVGLEKYITDRIYVAMREAKLRLPNERFTFHLGRAKDMFAKDEPTDAEMEELPDAFIRHWKIKGWADAPAALNEMRRQKARKEILEESSGGPAPWEPVNPHGDEGTRARRQPYKPMWYATFFGCNEDTAQGWIDEGLTHQDILARLEGRDETRGAA